MTRLFNNYQKKNNKYGIFVYVKSRINDKTCINYKGVFISNEKKIMLPLHSDVVRPPQAFSYEKVQP